MNDLTTATAGVFATGGYSTTGALQGFEARSGWPEARAATAARFAATGMMLLETIALGYGQLSGLEMAPARAWMYSGGDWTALVGEGRWTLCRSAEIGVPSAPRRGGDLGSFLERTGASDVGETTADGRLLAHETLIGLPEELAATGARFVHTVTNVMSELAGIYSILSDMDCQPATGWLYSGGAWTVAVAGRRWALAELRADPLEFFRGACG